MEPVTSQSIYSSLDPLQQEIRLIEIVATKPMLTCRLRIVSLLDNPCFSALSYVWGDEHDTSDIVVGSTKQPIATNLLAALEYTHLHWQRFHPGRGIDECRVWADALCINQENAKEKSHQVGMMGRIYSAAELVLGSLGKCPPKSQTPRAIRLLETIESQIRSSNFEPREGIKPHDLEWVQDYHDLFKEEAATKGDVQTKAACKAIEELMSWPYWTRAWIVQELVLAKACVIFHGPYALDLDTILHVNAWRLAVRWHAPAVPIPHSVRRNFFEMRSLDGIAFIGSLRAQRVRETRVILSSSPTRTRETSGQLYFESFSVTARFRASNLKDYVYAFIGLTNSRIVPDYSENKSFQSVYVEACTECLQACLQDRSAEPLCFLSLAGILSLLNEDLLTEIPSWVPVFAYRTADYRNVPPMVFKPPSDLPTINLSQDQISSWLFPGPLNAPSAKGNSLMASGIKIARVLDTSLCIMDRQDNGCSECFYSIRKLFRSISGKKGSQHPVVALARALGADITDYRLWRSPEVVVVIRLLQILALHPLFTTDPAGAYYARTFSKYGFTTRLGASSPTANANLDAEAFQAQKSLPESSIIDHVAEVSTLTATRLDAQGLQKRGFSMLKFLEDIGLGLSWVDSVTARLGKEVETCVKGESDWASLIKTKPEAVGPLKFLQEISSSDRLYEFLESPEASKLYEWLPRSRPKVAIANGTHFDHLGVVPQTCRKGDVITVLQGCSRLALLRPTRHYHRFVGFCSFPALGDAISLQMELGRIHVVNFEIR